MFHPDGLIPLIEIRQICNNISWDRFPTKSTAEYDDPPDPRYEVYSELIFSRFLEANDDKLWVFKYPDIILRASMDILFQYKVYDGPCPEEVDEASSVLAHIRGGPRIFLTDGMRVNSSIPMEDIQTWHLQELVDDAERLQGGLVCWKPNEWPVDPEREVARFTDHVHWKGHAVYGQKFISDEGRSGLLQTYNDFKLVCPNGKMASGLTWLEIQEKTGWSRRQIVRALDVFGDESLSGNADDLRKT